MASMEKADQALSEALSWLAAAERSARARLALDDAVLDAWPQNDSDERGNACLSAMACEDAARDFAGIRERLKVLAREMASAQRRLEAGGQAAAEWRDAFDARQAQAQQVAA